MEKNKQILMVFTGGTISSRIHKKALELGTAPYTLLESAKKTPYSFDIIEPVSVFSENITPEMYRVLFSSIDKAFSPNKHCGIMIAHGTDTMPALSSQTSLAKYTVPSYFSGTGGRRTRKAGTGKHRLH